MEELELKDFFKYVLSKLVIILACVVLALIAGASYTFNIKEPMYKSNTTIVLTAEKNNTNTAITQNDLTINKSLVSTYSQIIKSKKVLKQVIKNLKLDMTVGELSSIVSVEAISNTEIISITVSNKDAKKAPKIANEIARIFMKEIVSLYNIENVNVVDKAEESKMPYNMNYVKDVIIYLFIGFVISFAIIIITFYFDTTIKSTEEIETKLNLPILGSVPAPNKKHKINSELVVHDNSKSIISEGIKTLRTNLQFSSVDKKLKSILVTSSIPGEGKSFTSANLATAFAQDGRKVLLVDCDMRKGRQHYMFNVKNDLGLSNLLISDNIENYREFFKKTKVENLFVLTMGTIPPNPSELLGSEKNKKIMDLFSKHFDIVIYDSVPVNGLPDSLIMSRLVDKVVVVTELKHTPYDLLNNTKKSLEKVNADIAGVVVNKVAANNKKAYTYSKYYG
ncbi:MAG: polysaccharide biosynthesis tyrosine autokinase [Lactobacillales bacterium]|nr:polysaccharide biosynthesis tyrosine autokinase [Lactobacillales bacterium]